MHGLRRARRGRARTVAPAAPAALGGSSCHGVPTRAARRRARSSRRRRPAGAARRGRSASPSGRGRGGGPAARPGSSSPGRTVRGRCAERRRARTGTAARTDTAHRPGPRTSARPRPRRARVAHVVGFEDDDRLRPRRVQARPDVARARRWRERVEHEGGASGLDRERGDLGLPVESLAPVGVGVAPQPQACRRVAHLDAHGGPAQSPPPRAPEHRHRRPKASRRPSSARGRPVRRSRNGYAARCRSGCSRIAAATASTWASVIPGKIGSEHT